MFKLAIASFALLNVGLAASAVTPAAPAPASAPGSDAANAIRVLTTCDGINQGVPCFFWQTTVLPTLCGELSDSGQNDTVSSVQTVSGIHCTLWADEGCSGASQLVDGIVNNLGTVDFDNVASSFNCSAT